MTDSEAERRAALVATKLRAIVGANWGLPDDVTAGTSPAGASLNDRAGGHTWIYLDEDPARRLGMGLALALRGGQGDRPNHLHVVVGADDADAAAVLARRASTIDCNIDVWTAVGPELTAAVAAEPAVDAAPAPEAELYRPVLAAAGLEPVVEGGEVIGEYRGLEGARVVVDDKGGAHVEAGVGRFDREAGAMMFAHLGETDALARAVDVVRRSRHATAERHPLNQLVPERWLRSVVVANPAIVGAKSLRPVGSACPRRNLREIGVATAVGTGSNGEPVVVVCSTGIDMELVPAAADDRLTHGPDARLVLAVPADDLLGLTEDLVALMHRPAEIVTVPDDWRSLSEVTR